MIMNTISNGSCVYRGGGGGETASYKKKFKTLYSLTKKCPGGHKISIIDICYANTASLPKTLMVSLLNK